MRPLVCLLLIAACEPPAGSGSSGAAPSSSSSSSAPSSPSPERRSAELETCARTADCAGELRCVGGECRPAAESVAGELEAALGDRSEQAGRFVVAAEHYGRAIAAYEAAGLPAPARHLCAQGAALTASRGDATRIELAARLLHRCLLASPPGSRPHQRALAELAVLVDRGLDPAAIARPQLADVYLSGQATPSPESMRVALEGDGRARGRAYRELLARLPVDPGTRPALARCWQRHLESGGAPTLRVVLRFRHGFRLDEDDDFDRATIAIEAPPVADPALAAAGACAAAALQPLAEPIVRRAAEEASWDVPLTLTLTSS